MERGTCQDPCSCLKKSVAYHNWFALPERLVFDVCTCTICLAGVFEDGSEQKCRKERSSVQDSRTWVEVRNCFYGRSPDRSMCLQFV